MHFGSTHTLVSHRCLVVPVVGVAIKVMGTLLGEASLVFSFLPSCPVGGQLMQV